MYISDNLLCLKEANLLLLSQPVSTKPQIISSHYYKALSPKSFSLQSNFKCLHSVTHTDTKKVLNNRMAVHLSLTWRSVQLVLRPTQFGNQRKDKNSELSLYNSDTYRK